MGSSVLLALLCFLALGALHAQSTQGFISIDCGLDLDSNYTDEFTHIFYSLDDGYVDGGVNMDIPRDPTSASLSHRYLNLRIFPNGTRNCYTMGTVKEGVKYLVRAGFLYGNYDGKNQPPQFDLYLGVNLWRTVNTLADDVVTAEIIAISPTNVLQVCLLNTGMGTPFISVLEVRPLHDSMYPLVNESQSLVLNRGRVDAAETKPPVDPYDRIWFGNVTQTGWRTVTANGDINRPEADIWVVPGEILRTATEAKSLVFHFSGGPQEKLYLFLYFAELQQLGPNETREFNVLSDGQLLHGAYRPTYLTLDVLDNLLPEPQSVKMTYNFTLEATANSTLDPMINAHEIYSLKQLEESPTDAHDGDSIEKTTIYVDVTAQAMLKIKDFYKVKKNWQGDPCVPRNLTWERVSCRYDSKNPRIVSLNLSHSALAGEIHPFIVELMALRTLDLSHNNLTGEIPSGLGKLPNLQVLNLINNQLTGVIPQILYKKSQNGTLSLSTEGNTQLCNNTISCKIIGGKKKNIVPIAVGVSVSAIVLLGIFILVWRLKGRKRGTVQSAPHAPGIPSENSRDSIDPQAKRQQHDLNMENHQFSFLDIVKITGNFERMIGRGGFGIVYHGLLNDGREVAVKMISKSSQGEKEFHAEVQILLRVHHKNLVYLLGYCDDRNNLALVYEYMQKGSLADFLSGLDYLHSFCKPSIVHRDVKTGNILLNAKLEAKLGDFGLSKLFSHEDATHISTAVAGTPGYLDPEYYQTYRLTEKSDIYSFGIVLLEIISGKSPISRDPQSAPIVSWVQSRLERGDISSIADQRLNNGYDLNSIWKAAEVAMACASPTSSCRPKMTSHDISGSFSVERSNSNYTGPTVFYSSTIPSAR
ncbi:unnamed protein product [Spirodela intermedia]|uniref:Protein kinase domain-containing protein n=1 Tax=Spirodela intermedia TaxID=51605 RepID=A0A7I8JRX2_SPIIN|nr:unnamed protein product [Spirodela intermedia]CAA6672936.1 unnamed protein product [Spirodela intermedia]